MQPEQTCTFDFFGSPTSTQLQLASDSAGTPLYDHLSTAATVPSINPMRVVFSVNQDSHTLSVVDLEIMTTPISFQDDSPVPTGFTIPRTPLTAGSTPSLQNESDTPEIKLLAISLVHF